MGDTRRYLSQRLSRHRLNHRSAGMIVQGHRDETLIFLLLAMSPVMIETLIPTNQKGSPGSSPGENGSSVGDSMPTPLIVRATPLLQRRAPLPVPQRPAHCGRSPRTGEIGQFRQIGPDSVLLGRGLDLSIERQAQELAPAELGLTTGPIHSQASKKVCRD